MSEARGKLNKNQGIMGATPYNASSKPCHPELVFLFALYWQVPGKIPRRLHTLNKRALSSPLVIACIC